MRCCPAFSFIVRLILMDLLLAFAGIGGTAFALMSGPPLPSDTDFKNAKIKLDANPVDPDANTVVGKYMAFVQGDYVGAMPYLVHSADKPLRTLAEHELDPSYTDTAPKKVGMGDEWLVASKSNQALSRIFYDRAGQWYSAAWSDLDPVWKDRSRIQGRKLSASRPPGSPRKLGAGWVADPGNAGVPAVLDGAISRTGSYSGKVSPANPKVQNSYSALKSELLPISGKVLETSIYVLTDGTEGGSDRVYAMFFDQAGNQIQTDQAFIPTDLPFWNRIYIKSNVPKTAVRAQFSAVLNSKNGTLWLDDASMKVDGKEMLKNPGFEG